MNRRTAEQGTAEYRSEKHYHLLSSTSAVRNSLFDIQYSKHKRGGTALGRSEIINHTERDFRFWNVNFRFKSSIPRGKECMHLDLESTICNHKFYRGMVFFRARAAGEVHSANFADQGCMVGQFDLWYLKFGGLYFRAVKNIIQLSSWCPAGVRRLALAVGTL
jgi:hypothetical protein